MRWTLKQVADAVAGKPGHGVDAMARVAGSPSYPNTPCPAAASARSSDPPIRPSPITAARTAVTVAHRAAPGDGRDTLPGEGWG